VGSPSGSIRTRLKDPEQVFHAVVQRERIAFDVEEEITRPRAEAGLVRPRLGSRLPSGNLL